MFGIFADMAKETIRTVKCVDDAVTDLYRDVKQTTEEMGIGPESQREFIREITKK